MKWEVVPLEVVVEEDLPEAEEKLTATVAGMDDVIEDDDWAVDDTVIVDEDELEGETVEDEEGIDVIGISTVAGGKSTSTIEYWVAVTDAGLGEDVTVITTVWVVSGPSIVCIETM